MNIAEPVSSRAANSSLSKVIASVSGGGTAVPITSHGRITAYVVSPDVVDSGAGRSDYTMAGYARRVAHAAMLHHIQPLIQYGVGDPNTFESELELADILWNFWGTDKEVFDRLVIDLMSALSRGFGDRASEGDGCGIPSIDYVVRLMELTVPNTIPDAESEAAAVAAHLLENGGVYSPVMVGIAPFGFMDGNPHGFDPDAVNEKISARMPHGTAPEQWIDAKCAVMLAASRYRGFPLSKDSLVAQVPESIGITSAGSVLDELVDQGLLTIDENGQYSA